MMLGRFDDILKLLFFFFFKGICLSFWKFGDEFGKFNDVPEHVEILGCCRELGGLHLRRS